MTGINLTGTELYGNYSHSGNVLIVNNYRYMIYEALRKDLAAIKKINGFSVDISDVVAGDEQTDIKDRMIVIMSLRDVAVIEYQGTTVNRNSFLLRSQTKLRNLYITFRLYVKEGNRSRISDSEVRLRENYVDEIIKGLYGYNENARNLKTLLFTGCQNDFGLVAYEISEIKPYSLKKDVDVRFEGLFQYKQKFF